MVTYKVRSTTANGKRGEVSGSAGQRLPFESGFPVNPGDMVEGAVSGGIVQLTSHHASEVRKAVRAGGK